MPTRLLERIAQAEATAHTRFGVGGAVGNFGPLVAVASGQRVPIDTVWHDGSRAPTPDEWAAAEAFCEQHGQPVILHLLSHALPALLPALSERGYLLSYGLHVHTHDLRPLPVRPHDITVSEEADPLAWAQLSAAGFGDGTLDIMQLVAQAAGVRRFVAQQGGVPVATAAFAIQDGIAAFHGTSTLPDYRGRGAQSALLSHRIQKAREAGAALASVFVTPSSLSEQNVERAGFRLAGMRLTFERREQST